MTTNPELITTARTKAKDHKADRQEEIERAIEDYEVACELSRGRDPERNAHWTGKAKLAERRLSRMVKPASIAQAAGRVS